MTTEETRRIIERQNGERVAALLALLQASPESGSLHQLPTSTAAGLLGVMGQALITAMADAWSAQAVALEGVSKRGSVGMQKDLRSAAVLARGFAVKLVDLEVSSALAEAIRALRSDGGDIDDWFGVDRVCKIGEHRCTYDDATRAWYDPTATAGGPCSTAGCQPGEPWQSARFVQLSTQPDRSDDSDSPAQDDAQVAGAIQQTLDDRLDAVFGPLAADKPMILTGPPQGGARASVPSIEGGGLTVSGVSLPSDSGRQLQLLEFGPTTSPLPELAGGIQIVAPAARPPRITWDEIALAAELATQRQHVSWSTIETMGDCSLKWLLGHAHQTDDPTSPYRWPDGASWSLVGGKAVHHLVDVLHCTSLEVPTSEAEWLEVLDNAAKDAELQTGIARADFQVAGQGKETGPWWQVEGFEMIKRYVSYWRDQQAQGWRVTTLGEAGAPAVELAGVLTLTDPLTGQPVDVKLVLDSLWWHPEHGYRLVDLKTGAHTPSTPDQLGLYAHWAAEQLTPMHRFSGTIAAGYWMARKGSHDGEIANALDISRTKLGMLAGGALRAIRAGAFLPRVTTFGVGCGQCGQRDRCPARAGE